MKKLILSISILFIVFNGNSQDVATLDSLLKNKIDQNIQPYDSFGISVSITHPSGYSLNYATGHSHKNTTLTTDMVLGIGSNSKLFTSVLCLRFQEQGLLNLDSPLYTWLSLSAYPNIDSNATLRQCLQHNTGFADYVDMVLPDSVITNPTHSYTYSEILSLVNPPLFAIGTKVVYASTNYILAEMVLSNVSGINYYQLVRDSILTPLIMDHTYSEGFETINDIIAHPRHNNTDMHTVPRIALSTVARGAGCIIATMEDMTKWYNEIFYNNFINASSLSQMTNFIDWYEIPYKMGLGIYRLTYMQETYWGHSGQTIGYNSYFLTNYNSGYTVCVTINDTYESPYSLALQLNRIMADYHKWLGIEATINNNNINISPNPSKDIIKITSDYYINKIELFDMKGQLIYNLENINNSTVDINIGKLPKGAYSLIIYWNNNKSIKKIIKV